MLEYLPDDYQVHVRQGGEHFNLLEFSEPFKRNQENLRWGLIDLAAEEINPHADWKIAVRYDSDGTPTPLGFVER